MTLAEKAALLQDEGLLTVIRDRVRQRFFNRWSIETDPAKRETLWLANTVAEDAIQEIANMAREYRENG